MNPWRKGSLAENPYYRTAFGLARVPREIIRHKTIVELIGQSRRLIRAAPQAHLVAGAPLTEAMLNAAEEILLDPKQRIVEELLEHASEKPAREPLRKLAAEVAARMEPAAAAGAAPITNLTALRPWAGQLVTQFLASCPAPDPSFGALELELVPPFGRAEETTIP